MAKKEKKNIYNAGVYLQSQRRATLTEQLQEMNGQNTESEETGGKREKRKRGQREKEEEWGEEELLSAPEL